MRQFIFLLFIIMLASCSKDSTKVNDSDSERITTLEIIKKANADTCCYKYAEINNVTYILKDNKVIHKVCNDSASVRILTIIVVLFILAAWVIALIKFL